MVLPMSILHYIPASKADLTVFVLKNLREICHRFAVLSCNPVCITRSKQIKLLQNVRIVIVCLSLLLMTDRRDRP